MIIISQAGDHDTETVLEVLTVKPYTRKPKLKINTL